MKMKYETDLYQRIHAELRKVGIVDCHEHLLPEAEYPSGNDISIGRLFTHYANCDLRSAGLPAADMTNKLQNPKSGLSPKERWKVIQPYYEKSWNTAYNEGLRIAMRDLYGVDDLSIDTVDALTDAMKRDLKPGFMRKVFDKAGIDFAMNQTWAKPVRTPGHPFNCFIADMLDDFTGFGFEALRKDSGREIQSLDDYLRLIDFYFDRYGKIVSAFKCGRAYDRTLYWEDVPRSAVEGSFNRLLAFNDRPDRREIQALEDFILHYLCRQCGEHGIRMKFHTGIQEGNGNVITNSRAALLCNLFMKYPETQFDLYHIGYPYQDEVAVLSKNFPNVTIDFAWMWVINPAAGRRALSEMLDTVPANKIHGFGGDYIFVEGTYGHAVIARREIARVLCEKVEEGRFSEAYAVQVGHRLLRDNAMENFGLKGRRAALKKYLAANPD